MGVFDEAAIGDELYYIVGVRNNITIFKKLKKYLIRNIKSI